MWTPEQIEFMKKHYPNERSQDIADHLGKTYAAVVKYAQKIGINKSREFLHSDKSGRIQKGQHKCKSGEFKKGHNPWNAGRTGVRTSPKSEFKKGNLPHNTLHDGAISIRRYRCRKTGKLSQYKFIRVRLGKWVPLHRHIWEQQHGNISNKHVLRFKDGNSLNCNINNLELITRAQHARNNYNDQRRRASLQALMQDGDHPSHNLTDKYIIGNLTKGNPDMRPHVPQELIDLKRNTLLLKRKLKNHEKQVK